MKLVKFFALAVAALAVSCAAEENKTNAPDFELTESTIYCDVTAAGWEKVFVHAWNDNGDLTGGWPGVEITEKAEKDGKEYFVWVAPAELCGQTIGFILNCNDDGLGNAKQTEDIKITVTDGLVVSITEQSESGKWLATGGEVVTPAPKDEPVVVLGDHSWGLIGVNGDWENDIEMTVAGGVATATVELPANGEFKVRADKGWDINYGFNSEDGSLAPVDGTQFAANFNGGNIKVADAGTYEVVLSIEGENEYLQITKK